VYGAISASAYGSFLKHRLFPSRWQGVSDRENPASTFPKAPPVQVLLRVNQRVCGMERPSTIVSLDHARPRSRIVGLAFVGALHVLFVYALVSGLAVRMAMQLPHELIAQVVQPPQPKSDPPPPAAPNLAQPSLPTVEMPLIKIEQPRAVTHPITTYVGPPVPVHVAPVVTVPTPAVAAPTPPSAIARTHTIPPYPEIARRLSQQGSVRLSIEVGADGRVSNAAVVGSSGTAALDDAAVDWVKNHWLYKPATQEGKPVTATVPAMVEFNLKNA
jgi:protein TonB